MRPLALAASLLLAGTLAGCWDELRAAPDAGVPDAGSADAGGERCLDVQCPTDRTCFEGECLARCNASVPTAASGCLADELCVPQSSQSGRGDGVCMLRCDVLAPSCPQTRSGVAQSCYLGSRGAVCAPMAGNGREAGETCWLLNQCVAGASCFAYGSAGRCREVCERASPDVCEAGARCEPVVGHDDVGVCR